MGVAHIRSPTDLWAIGGSVGRGHIEPGAFDPFMKETKKLISLLLLGVL
jgi:hypothetical protein